MNGKLKAVILTIVSVGSGSFLDGLSKLLSDKFPFQEIVAGRFFFACLTMLPLLISPKYKNDFKTKRLGLHFVRGFLFCIGLFLSEETAEHTADLIKIDLCLYSVSHFFDLIVGQVDADEILHDLHGVCLEFVEQLGVSLDLLYQRFCFCLDVHSIITFILPGADFSFLCYHSLSPIARVWNFLAIRENFVYTESK